MTSRKLTSGGIFTLENLPSNHSGNVGPSVDTHYDTPCGLPWCIPGKPYPKKWASGEHASHAYVSKAVAETINYL